MARTAEQIMERMGFPASENGPYVTTLRKEIERQVRDHGLVGRSPGSWAHGNFSHEERARAILQIEWEMQHGYSFRQECMDALPLDWTFDTRTMRWHLKVRPSRLLPWIGDRWREARMHLRIWRDRLVGRENPYRL